MRKFLALLAAAALTTFALTACGGGDDPVEQAEDAAESAADQAADLINN